MIDPKFAFMLLLLLGVVVIMPTVIDVLFLTVVAGFVYGALSIKNNKENVVKD